MPGIEIRGLSKVFREHSRALEGVDLDVADGELLVLVGPSGSGKTTLLRLIAGLDQPTAGTIRIQGKDLSGIPPHQRNVALVFQNLALYGHLNVADNLRFGLSHETGDQGSKRVEEAAELLGIVPLLDRWPAELSGGEQQRVALGRAMVRQPAAWLLDEPLSSLDGPARRGLRRELKRLQRRLGVPTIYVTHDQAEALALGDRIAVLDGGRLQQVGIPEEVYRQPSNLFVAEFFGPQGMNLIEGELQSEGGEKVFVTHGFRLALPPGLASGLQSHTNRLVCGFRPEDVVVVPPGRTARQQLPGTVKTREYFGDTTYLGVVLERLAEITVKVTSQSPPADRFDVISLQLDPEHACWFDATTGKRIQVLNPEP
jgi:ABC-type sugar transport system ATPase subunit